MKTRPDSSSSRGIEALAALRRETDAIDFDQRSYSSPLAGWRLGHYIACRQLQHALRITSTIRRG